MSRTYEMTRQDGGLIDPVHLVVTMTLRDFWEYTDCTDEQCEAIGDLGVNGQYVLDDGNSKFDIVRIK